MILARLERSSVIMDDNYDISDYDDFSEFDEGSDLDNWETNQVAQDNEGYDPEDAYLDSCYEDRFDLGD